MSRFEISDAEKLAIAQTVHEALRGWANAHGQGDIPIWSEAEEWMHASTLESVEFVLNAPNAPNESQHNQWMDQKLRDGWIFGDAKDAVVKTHPMLVPYDELPLFEQRKDALIKAIVFGLTANV